MWKGWKEAPCNCSPARGFPFSHHWPTLARAPLDLSQCGLITCYLDTEKDDNRSQILQQEQSKSIPVKQCTHSTRGFSGDFTKQTEFSYERKYVNTPPPTPGPRAWLCSGRGLPEDPKTGLWYETGRNCPFKESKDDILCTVLWSCRRKP